MANLYCIVDNDGMIEDGFATLAEAESRLRELYGDDSGDVSVELRSNYDADGDEIQ